ncbi:Uncharacterised protein [Brucella melitensis]|nr:Uncharacterised protein [Brucella melitensis]
MTISRISPISGFQSAHSAGAGFDHFRRVSARRLRRCCNSRMVGGRMKIDTTSGWHLGLQLVRPLPIDIEQHVLPIGQRNLGRFAQRTIKIAVHFGPFDQLVIVAQALEFADRDEMKCTPSISLGRRWRVVTLMESESFIFGSSRSSRAMVDFPAPDGDEITTIKPLRSYAIFNRRYGP